MTTNRYPPGWDEARVRRVLAHYESQSDTEAVAEDESAFERSGYVTVQIPIELLPSVRALLTEHDR